MTTLTATHRTNDLNEILRELDRLNEDARENNLWIRTKWNLANQKPWHLGESGAPARGPHNLPLEHVAPVPYLWKWADIERYLMTLTELCPLELTERQSVLLTNPAYGVNGVKVTNTIRIAISIYKKGDLAHEHWHTPNASRTIISDTGGYTTVEGETMSPKRGDLVFTPNGTWHGHGNHDENPVIWADTLDWPLMDYLGLTSMRGDLHNAPAHGNPPSDFSKRAFGRGGIKPLFHPHQRGNGQAVSPMFHHEAADIQGALRDLSCYEGDPYEGVQVEVVNPMTGASVFPTLSYRAQLLKPGQTTDAYRHTASQLYFVLEGSGHSEIDGQRFDWGRNDFFIAPNQSWRSHTVTGAGEAVLYSVTDAPLFQHLGQYRSQGRTGGRLIELG